jgi:hypothetical protein
VVVGQGLQPAPQKAGEKLRLELGGHHCGNNLAAAAAAAAELRVLVGEDPGLVCNVLDKR